MPVGRFILMALLAAAALPAAASGQRPRRLERAMAVTAVPASPGAGAQGAPARGPRVVPRLPASPSRLRAAKAAAARRAEASGAMRRAPRASGGATRPAPRAAAGGPNGAIFGGLNQIGLVAAENASQTTPPDTTGAIGPLHYLEFVNSTVRVYDRAALGTVSTADLATFVNAPAADVFDPQILWDGGAGRWFYLADRVDRSTTGADFLAFGWSKTADPTNLASGWCRFFVNTDSQFSGAPGDDFADYPKLGHNNARILFGTNLFVAGAFSTANVWSFARPANGDASCAPPGGTVLGSPTSPLQTASGRDAFTPVPANTTDASTPGYVVAADDPLVGPATQLSSYAADGSGNVAAPTALTVPSFAVPADVPQPGVPLTIDSSDTRLTQAVAHADPTAGGAEAVWTQHTVDGPGGRSVNRWYELLPATGTVRQVGTISDPSGFVFNSAVSPASDGSHAAVSYNVGSATALVSLAARSREGGTPPGAMSRATLLGTSDAALSDFGCDPPDAPPCRWGDYAAMTPDPANPTVVWGTGELTGPVVLVPPGQAQWKTRNFAFDATDLPPVAAFGPATASVLTVQAIAFDGSSSSDPDGTVDAFAWSFGDGATATGPSPTHAYGHAGLYPVTLTVTDDAGRTASTVHTAAVSDRAPGASFDSAPATPVTGRAVRFDGRRSSDPDGTIAAYAWQFGDGATGRGPTPRHAYGRRGTYRVTLTVTDDSGSRAATFRDVRVAQSRPRASATIARQRLARVARRGLVVNVRSDSAGAASGRLGLARRTARKLHLAATRSVIVGTGSARLARPGRAKLVIKLKRQARRRLVGARRVTLTLSLVVRDGFGGSSTIRKRVTLRR